VGDIKQMQGKALCVWGTITYDDIFGQKHFPLPMGWVPSPLSVYSWLVPNGETIRELFSPFAVVYEVLKVLVTASAVVVAYRDGTLFLEG